MGATGTQHQRAGGSLARRTVAASTLLSAVIGAAFLILAVAIDTLRSSEAQADHALEVLVAANHLERVVIDVETTQRGYVITGDGRLLGSWTLARAEVVRQSAELSRLTAADPDQHRRADQIGRAGQSYLRNYAIPLVAMAERDLNSARSVAVTEEGKQQVDALRMRFEHFMARQQQIFASHHARADAAANRALVASSVSVGASILLILFSGGYLARSVVRPVRRVSAMAGRVAGGDLSVRMPESGPGEVGGLERSFNSMTDSLESGRDELRRVVDEQAALRRVATLVARGISPNALFGAVAAETGGVLGAQTTAVVRFEDDDTATVAGSWQQPGIPGLAPALGSNWPPEQQSVAGEVRRTGNPARVISNEEAAGSASDWPGEHEIRSSVGTPIVVDGRLWGAIVALSHVSSADPDDTEERLLAFTELAAMAVANSESRAQVAASRARVVAAADESRRRIERNLHDGIQQRLISLALELQAAKSRMPPEQRSVADQWSRTAQGLTDVIEELREISRGLHPASLETRGLGPAMRTLARRSAVPVELTMDIPGRLPERVEVAVYYVVSEALANAAKHARASVAEVDVRVVGDDLRLRVHDDGVGGANAARGSGLVGLSDRVESAGGQLEISSQARHGTTLLITIPLKPTS